MRDASGRFIAGSGAPGWKPGGAAISVTLDERALARAMKRIERYADRPLERRAKQAYIEGVRLMRGPMIARTPVGKTGNLRRSVTARSNRLLGNEMAAATVGTRFRVAPHRHLVTAGHRIVTRGGRDTGRRSKANPFVDATFRALGAQVQSFITARVLDLGESFGQRY